MRRNWQGMEFSPYLAFVDTLTCMLGSMLLLWMAMVSRPQPLPGFGGGPEFAVSLAGNTEDPRPHLAIRLRVEGKVYTLHEVFKKGWIIPRTDIDDGKESYRIEFTKGASFTDGDWLLVYLNDLRGRDWSLPTKLEAVANDKPCPELSLTGTHPLAVVRLEQISGQLKSSSVEWVRP